MNDTEVITPQPAGTVITTGRRHHQEHHQESIDQIILREQLAGFRTADTYARNAALAAAHTDEESQENFATQQKQISDAATSTVVGFKDAQATAYQIEGRAALDAEKNANALAVQATSNFNLSQVQATSNFNMLTVQAEKLAAAALLDSTKNAAAATLLATQLAATAAAQLAECCCELREKITKDGDETRELINASEKERMREKIARLETAYAAAFTAKVPPVTPVP
jgi:hypothetical protein